MQQYIVIYGNPVDGTKYAGPFTDPDEATTWTEANHHETDWWVAPLEPVYPGEGAWHINVYERGRAYGGPEEGGWWYDTGVYCPMMSTTFDQSAYSPDEVNNIARALQDRLNEESNANNVPPVGATNYTGGRYLVQTDDQPGGDFPTDQPHYS